MLHENHPLGREETNLLEGDLFRHLLSEIPPEDNLEPLNPEDCLFFDIETTGLSSDTSFLFLIGCICRDDTSWRLHQFFIRMVQEEKELLSSFLKLAKNCRALVHFNGNTFDLPFLRGRAAANHIDAGLDDFISIDLYQHFRPLRRKLHLPHMNQSFLEKQAGWMREDTLSWKEVVHLFWTYAAQIQSNQLSGLSLKLPSGQLSTQELLLRHNHDDLTGMLHVLKLESCMALFSGQISSNVTAEESDDHAFLNIHFQLPHPLPKALELSIDLPDGGQCFLHVLTIHGKLQIPFFTGTLRYFLPDYKNYYYLPVENQVVHKSVASYVAKEYREKAKPENCFVTKNGRFLPSPNFRPGNRPDNEAERSMLAGPPFAPMFRKSHESKEGYFEYTSDLGQKQDVILPYIKLLLRQM